MIAREAANAAARRYAAGARNFLTDTLGSTIALADSAGTLQTQYGHDPFGNATVTGSSSANPYQFTGRENDGTGLYFYRARYYSPTYQRFIGQDPIGFRGGDANLYAYVSNSPTNFRDPKGRDLIGALIGGVGGGIIGWLGSGPCDSGWQQGENFLEGAAWGAGFGFIGGPLGLLGEDPGGLLGILFGSWLGDSGELPDWFWGLAGSFAGSAIHRQLGPAAPQPCPLGTPSSCP